MYDTLCYDDDTLCYDDDTLCYDDDTLCYDDDTLCYDDDFVERILRMKAVNCLSISIRLLVISE